MTEVVERHDLAAAGARPRRPQRRGRARRRRVGAYLATMFCLVTLNFLIPRAMPGDPITGMLALGGRATSSIHDEATRQALQRYYGLDRPLAVQYVDYLGGLARGDLGVSVRYNVPVTDLIVGRLPWTLLLGATATALAAVAGLIPGVHSGWRRGRAIDRGLLGLFIAVRNIPPFVLASLALFVFAVQLGWVPLGGATTPFSGPLTSLRGVLDVAHHLVLPASVMAVQVASYNYLVMRAAMVGELGADYVVLGRAKGLPERWLKYRYAARNALLPVVTLTAVQLGFAVTLAPIFVETIFSYPGLGRLVSEATAFRDYPTLQGCFVAFSAIVVSLNFVADLLAARLDPRTAG